MTARTGNPIPLPSDTIEVTKSHDLGIKGQVKSGQRRSGGRLRADYQVRGSRTAATGDSRSARNVLVDSGEVEAGFGYGFAG